MCTKSNVSCAQPALGHAGTREGAEPHVHAGVPAPRTCSNHSRRTPSPTPFSPWNWTSSGPAMALPSTAPDTSSTPS